MSPVTHPDRSGRGGAVRIWSPTTPSAPATWHDPEAVAVFTPLGPAPDGLHGIPLAPVVPPTDAAGWAALVAVPDMRPPPPTTARLRTRGAGLVIPEPDGRVWLVEPTNHFAGYHATFPKGTAERGYGLAALAAKEAYEEAGLLVEVGAWLVDAPRPSSIARYYLGRRIGGTPVAMGWESQAVLLAPRASLRGLLNRDVDHLVLDALEGWTVSSRTGSIAG